MTFLWPLWIATGSLIGHLRFQLEMPSSNWSPISNLYTCACLIPLFLRVKIVKALWTWNSLLYHISRLCICWRIWRVWFWILRCHEVAQANKRIFVQFLFHFCCNGCAKTHTNTFIEDVLGERIWKSQYEKRNFYFTEMLIQKKPHFNIKAYIAQTIEVFI